MNEPKIGTQSGTEATSAASDGVGNTERRKVNRFALSASAEMVEPRTQTQLTGRASDLGMGGCYVDTLTPYPVGTSLVLTVKSENHAVRAKASVIYAHAGMGMGLAFTELDGDQRRSLIRWLHELSGEPRNQQATDAGHIQQGEQVSAKKNAGPTEALQQLISLLRNKGILTDTEWDLLREKLGREPSSEL